MQDSDSSAGIIVSITEKNDSCAPRKGFSSHIIITFIGEGITSTEWCELILELIILYQRWRIIDTGVDNMMQENDNNHH